MSKAPSLAAQIIDLLGTPHIGLFMTASEKYCIVPRGITEKKRRLISDVLGVGVVEASVASTHILGTLCVMNSNGVLLPSITLGEEVEEMRRMLKEMIIERLPSRLTALGNLVAANDLGAVVSPEFSEREARLISEVLGVEVVRAKIAGRTYVGSICLLTNKGGLIHLDAAEEEVKLVSDVCRVAVTPATVNDGVKFVKSGVVANSKGVLLGARTNGPEMMNISRALSL